MVRQHRGKSRSTQICMLLTTVLVCGGVSAQEGGQKASSYAPVDIKEDFATTMEWCSRYGGNGFQAIDSPEL